MAHMMSTRKVHGEHYEDDDEREDDDEDAEKRDGDDDHGDGVTILISARKTHDPIRKSFGSKHAIAAVATAASMPSQP